MTKESRQKEFLERAKQADQEAERCRDPLARDTWRTIAQGYRDLAKTTGGKL